MDQLTTPDEMRAWRRERPGAAGFVPTMGFLHEGHLSLVRRAREENASVVVSIFVNPTQFGPGEDFERYPRDEARDLALLASAGVDAVYLPTPDVMYPDGFQTSVTVDEVAKRLEGEVRPGHFRGVATVVAKLFGAVEPTRAYFGRKDAQQLRVIQRMVRDLDMGIEIVPCPTTREADGLAMSSRNVYLTPRQRAEAPVLYRALLEGAAAFAGGDRDADVLRQMVRTRVGGQSEGSLEYVSLADDTTLDEIEGRVEGPALLSLAAKFGQTRLIDNVELASGGEAS